MADAAYLNYIISQIGLYFSGILEPIGIISCLICAAVFFLNKNLNKTNMGILYGYLSAVTFSSMLADYLVGNFLLYLPSFSPFMNRSDTWCQTSYFLLRVTAHSASWLQAYISFDRLVQIKYPAKMSLLKNKLYINLVVLTLISLIFLANMGNWFLFVRETTKTDAAASIQNQTSFYDERKNQTTTNETIWLNRTRVVSRACSGSAQVLLVTDVMSSVMRTWFPFVFLITFNVWSIRLLSASSKRVQATSTSSPNEARSRREKEFTRTVHKLSAIFFFTNFPLSASWVCLNFYRSFAPDPSPTVIAGLGVMVRSTLALANGYQASTFFINLAFNKLFRQELLHQIRRIKRETHAESAPPTSSRKIALNSTTNQATANSHATNNEVKA